MITFCIAPECGVEVSVFDLAPLCPSHLGFGKGPFKGNFTVTMEHSFYLTKLGHARMQSGDGCMVTFLRAFKPRYERDGKHVVERVSMALKDIEKQFKENVAVLKDKDNEALRYIHQEIADNVLTLAKRAYYSRYLLKGS